MGYDPKIHHRRSIRLKGYDYSQPGLYFVTICCQNHEMLFGHIENYKMILNDAGRMVEKWYYELENKFTDLKCHEMVVMPNHFHCIIENVGADLRVCPNGQSGEHVGSGEHTGSPLRSIVQWFKTMTTNEYIRGVKRHGWRRFDKKLWQRNYWEHIVRNADEYYQISDYIENNPINWENDKLNGGFGNCVLEDSVGYGENSWMI